METWRRLCGGVDGNSRDSQFQYNLQAVPPPPTCPRVLVSVLLVDGRRSIGGGRVELNSD